MEATIASARTLDRALEHLLAQQNEDGCWEGEMVWCTMILSQYVIVQHLLGRHWDDETRRQIRRHYEVTQSADGAWGLHPESHGYVFTTTLAYVALRLLGVPANDALAARARCWLHAQPEGVFGIPAWGKFWLALIGLYEYDGINPTLPELFLLPEWLPIHPSRYYCHTRYIYLAMSYLSGSRFRRDLGPITTALRHELYPGRAYSEINFAAYRNCVAATDLFVRPSPLLRVGYRILNAWDRWRLPGMRRRALDFCFERILFEQRSSRYQAISPVNGLLNCLVLHSQDHADLTASQAGLEAWRWEDAEEGLRYVGARSQTWDTAFAMQAILASPRSLTHDARDALHRAYRYLKRVQATDELPDHQRERRASILGGWCFSDGVHRWPVSDCTAEALCAILQMHAHPALEMPAAERIADVRLEQAARFILDRQNSDGGFGTYERRRGPRFLNALNPSEMYGGCMVEGSYIECTGSALAALAHFHEAYPVVLRDQIERARRRAIRFLRRSQRRDGAWLGDWGINITYGIFHAVKGLRAAGVPATDRALQRALCWLEQAQQADGGWGEHFQGCLEGRYVERASQPVMTSWALLALLQMGDPGAPAIRRGLAWLKRHQQEDGGWQQAAVNGVFFGTAMLDYRLYKSYFPTWALRAAESFVV